MDSIAHPPLPIGADVKSEAEVCPICLTEFHGHDVAPVDVKTQCRTHCGHHFHLDCISEQFVYQPIGSRHCAVCRQDPMPVVNLDTSEPYPDTSFPNQAFYDACYYGDLDQVERSLAEGVNVNAVMTDGLTALMLASINGHTDIVERLINAGAEVNTARNEDGGTPLLFAAQENNSDCVKLLINKGADLNAEAKNGATPVSIAAAMGNTDCLKALIEAKANLNTRDEDGVTALFIPVQNNYIECVKLLLNAGADPTSGPRLAATCCSSLLRMAIPLA
ncbi:ankyrin repeat domain-containing protein [Endozoicomonas sp. 2B-B]